MAPRELGGHVLLVALFDEATDLDAIPGPGLREGDRGLAVRQLEDREPADRVLRLDERAVDDDSLVTTRADRCRRPCWLQLRATVGDLRAVGLEPLEDVGVDLLLLRRWCALVVHAVVDEEKCVLRHVRPPFAVLVGTTNGLPRDRQLTRG